MKRLSSSGNPTSPPRNKQSFSPMKWFVIWCSRKKSQTLIHHHCTHCYVTARIISSELCCSHRKAAAGAPMTCPKKKRTGSKEIPLHKFHPTIYKCVNLYDDSSSIWMLKSLNFSWAKAWFNMITSLEFLLALEILLWPQYSLSRA